MDSQSKKTLFQTIILIFFGVLILVAVAMFAMNKGTTKVKEGELVGSLEVWGVLPYETMRTAFDSIQIQYDGLRVNYTQKTMDNLEKDLTEAFANGDGPDVFTLTPEMILTQQKRLLMIPYESFSETAFRSVFADQANMFMTPSGIAGFPMYINPLVLYVNNDILTSNYIVQTPTSWDEIVGLSSTLVKKSESGTLLQPVIGMGSYNNVSHALPIIATLLFQSGDTITTRNSVTGLVSSFVSSTGSAVFDFYTGFSNTQSDFYVYNNTFPTDRDLFIGGRLPFYIGFAEEVSTIRAKNPNLNFDITMMPAPSQGRNIVFGHMTGWGISKTTKNSTAAIGLTQIMSGSNFIGGIIAGRYLAPARKDMLSVIPTNDALRGVIYKSAIISRSFINPDPEAVNDSLSKNINQVNSNLITPQSAYTNWIADTVTLLDRYQK